MTNLEFKIKLDEITQEAFPECKNTTLAQATILPNGERITDKLTYTIYLTNG